MARPFESLIIASLWASAMVSIVTTMLIIVVLSRETITFFQDVSFAEFFLSTEWQPLLKPVSFGAWEPVAGTLNVVLWSLLIALPIGLMSAIFLSEYAHPRTRQVLKPLLEALAGVPTVVYAYFALTFITQGVRWSQLINAPSRRTNRLFVTSRMVEMRRSG